MVAETRAQSRKVGRADSRVSGRVKNFDARNAAASRDLSLVDNWPVERKYDFFRKRRYLDFKSVLGIRDILVRIRTSD